MHARHPRCEVAQVGEEILTQAEQQFARPVRKRVVDGQLGIRLRRSFTAAGGRASARSASSPRNASDRWRRSRWPGHRESPRSGRRPGGVRRAGCARSRSGRPGGRSIPEGAVLVGLRASTLVASTAATSVSRTCCRRDPRHRRAAGAGRRAGCRSRATLEDAGPQQRRLPEAGDAKQHGHRSG